MEERRRDERKEARLTAYLVVVTGKDGSLRSPREKVKIRDISTMGASVVARTVRPGGYHVMYNDLMLYKNRVELQVEKESGETVVIPGRVVWYDKPDDFPGYILGIEFSERVDVSTLLEE
ncbi:MAG: hypothetical protein D6713_07875 [Deltaproteobacteria bacterium]|nr:MAG: hypothetical protein D6713_07875 [Deltaproteobacteria bacterium]